MAAPDSVSLKLRSVLVVVVGLVLGLTVTLGTQVLSSWHVAPARDTRLASDEFRLLADVIESVRMEYVEQIDDRELVDAAIRGILGELDEHSRFLDARDYEDIRISTTGNYSGVGLDVSLENGEIKVVAPLDGAPASLAGILPGDVLVSVDAVPVDGDNIDDTVNRMRGEPGTAVTLGVRRDGVETPLEFAVTRAEIQVKTVSGELLDDSYAYLRVASFSDTTGRDLGRAVEQIRSESPYGLRGAILDLRNNPGGVLDAAVDVADAFLDSGLIVRGTGRVEAAQFAHYARPGDLLDGLPLTVLVNGGSASASEIVAGALQDRRRARIVGERTYGKGSVQSVLPLRRGGAIKLTTSRYFTPSGRSISGTGVRPDAIVAGGGASTRYRGRSGTVAAQADQQLQEAMRLMGTDPIKLSSSTVQPNPQ